MQCIRDTPGPLSRNPSDLSRLGSHSVLRADRDEQTEWIIQEKQAAMVDLEREVQRLTNVMPTRTSGVERREHPLEPVMHVVDDRGTRGTNIGRHASMATAKVLRGIEPIIKVDELAQKMVKMFKSPKQHADYLTSETFARDMQSLCQKAAPLFEAEPRCVFVQSPVYVFGDIHGNLEDLHFFADNLWKLGINLTAGKFLFLGDYVDRGMLGLETIAYLFALKIENPDKIIMLRGNHELRDVNGWVEYYREKSFLYHCKKRFGEIVGAEIWEECNRVFDRLPLAAVIDHDIFCVHGGIPRPLKGSNSRIKDILSVPAVAGVCPPNDSETFESQQTASDCLWSDPAKAEREKILDMNGYGESPRGGGAICFGEKAINNFLKEGKMSYIIRAHEAHSEGVSLSKGAKVFTVFSTSKDHGQGQGAMCGCILVDFDRIQVINRSTKYKNKYVHRRDSMSLANLSSLDKAKLAHIGFVTEGCTHPPPYSSHSSYDDEEYDDYIDHSINEDSLESFDED